MMQFAAPRIRRTIRICRQLLHVPARCARPHNRLKYCYHHASHSPVYRYKSRRTSKVSLSNNLLRAERRLKLKFDAQAVMRTLFRY